MKLTPGKLILITLGILAVATICIIGVMYTTDENYATEMLEAYDNVTRGRSTGIFANVSTLVEAYKEMQEETPESPDAEEPSTGDDTGAGGEAPEPATGTDPKVLEPFQYLNQGDPAYGNTTMASGKTIHAQGCCMCSYMMVASHYSKSNWTTAEIISFATNQSNYSGSAVYGMHALEHKGVSATQRNLSTSKADFQNNIKSAIDAGHPIILQIYGHWEEGGIVYHNNYGGHFLVVRGYCDEGFYVLDPGNKDVTYSHNPIPWDKLNSLPRIDSVREIIA